MSYTRQTLGCETCRADAHFVVEPREPAGVGGERFGQELERHRLAERQIVGAIDLAHAAAAEQADDAIAAGEHGPRGENGCHFRALIPRAGTLSHGTISSQEPSGSPRRRAQQAGRTMNRTGYCLRWRSGTKGTSP